MLAVAILLLLLTCHLSVAVVRMTDDLRASHPAPLTAARNAVILWSVPTASCLAGLGLLASGAVPLLGAGALMAGGSIFTAVYSLP